MQSYLSRNIPRRLKPCSSEVSPCLLPLWDPNLRALVLCKDNEIATQIYLPYKSFVKRLYDERWKLRVELKVLVE